MFAKLKSYLIFLGGLAAALFAAYVLGRKDGGAQNIRKDLSEERARRTMAAEGAQIDRETSQRSEDELREELNKWAN